MPQDALFEVNQPLRVERVTLVARLEVQVFRRCPACAPHDAYHLACLDHLAHGHKVLGVVTIARLKTVVMADGDALAIAGEDT